LSGGGWAWVRWAKLNVLQKHWLVCRLAALLILRSLGILSFIFSSVVDGLHCPTITGNEQGFVQVGY